MNKNNPMYGKKHSDETKKKISESRKGKCCGRNNPMFGVSLKPWNKGLKGIHLSPDTEFKKGSIPWNKDKTNVYSKERLQKMYGENNPNWKGGISSEKQKDYNSQEYKNWRQQVFERDNFTCQQCGQLRGEIEAHHIIPRSPYAVNKNIKFNIFKKFRHDINNGITLCKKCHGTIKNKELQFAPILMEMI